MPLTTSNGEAAVRGTARRCSLEGGLRLKLGSFKQVSVAATLCVAVPAGAESDVYGGGSITGVHSTSRAFLDDEELDASGFVGRGYAGVRWGPAASRSRVEASSSYYAYTRESREDRWSNSVEAEQRFRLGEKWTIGIEGRAASNLTTLERGSVDQLTGLAHLFFQPNRDHQLRLTGALRRRYYDGTDARSYSPMLEADYRYRLGRYNYVDLDARQEWVDSGTDIFDYDRLSVGAYYTHPFGRRTRMRAGIVHRRWSWDQRFADGGERRRDQLFLPQLRVTQELTDSINAEFDYRRLIRRSNDDALDRDGNRFAATVRARF